MDDSKKIGNYSLCSKCKRPIPLGKIHCLKCDSKGKEKITKLLEDLSQDNDIDEAFKRLMQPDDGLERAIERLKEKENE